MTTYQLISTVSGNLGATETDLLQLQDQRWIITVEKNGSRYISGRDAYKARFILHLRRLRVSDEEIGTVMDTFNPPYSLAEVQKLLARPLDS